jgi:hypothetical protein
MADNKTVDQPAVDLVRAAQKAHCLHYLQRIPNQATFRAVVLAMQDGNAFDPDAVVEQLGPLLDDACDVEIGLEFSAVVYITVPFWDHHRMTAAAPIGELGERLSDDWRIAYTERVLAVARTLGAEEISVAQHPYGDGPVENNAGERPYRIRLWWD